MLGGQTPNERRTQAISRASAQVTCVGNCSVSKFWKTEIHPPNNTFFVFYSSNSYNNNLNNCTPKRNIALRKLKIIIATIISQGYWLPVEIPSEIRQTKSLNISQSSVTILFSPKKTFWWSFFSCLFGCFLLFFHVVSLFVLMKFPGQRRCKGESCLNLLWFKEVSVHLTYNSVFYNPFQYIILQNPFTST